MSRKQIQSNFKNFMTVGNGNSHISQVIDLADGSMAFHQNIPTGSSNTEGSKITSQVWKSQTSSLPSSATIANGSNSPEDFRSLSSVSGLKSSRISDDSGVERNSGFTSRNGSRMIENSIISNNSQESLLALRLEIKNLYQLFQKIDTRLTILEQRN